MSSRVQTVLEAVTIGKRYRTRTALADVSFTLAAGKVYGLLGPNGAGKTTCLHLLTGLLDADSGEVRVLGQPISDKATRSSIGYAPDDLPLPSSLTGREYLQLHDRLRHRHDGERALAIAMALGLEEDLTRQISEYSHGMKRKLQLIAAVMHQPQLFILDEPFRGLDPEAAAVTRELLTSYVGMGNTVLLATHDMLRAERDCEEVLIVDRGRLIESGSPDELRNKFGSPDLEDVFLSATGMKDRRELRRELLEIAFE